MFYHIKICDKTEVRIHFLSDLLKEQGKSNPQNYILDDYNITRSSSLICENVKKENSMKSHLVNDLRKKWIILLCKYRNARRYTFSKIILKF